MLHSTTERISHTFARFFATNAALWLGIGIAVLWIATWLVEGRLHDFLTEAVGVLSFLTIFIFQRAQNKDLKAVHLKLDELLASSATASNRLIKAEEAPEHVLDEVHEIYKNVAKAAIDMDSRTSLVAD